VYGPTETTVTCLTFPLPADSSAWPCTAQGALPLGPAYPTVECLVVDADGYPGVEGELLIRGPQRFDGYLDPAHDVGRFALLDGGRVRDHDGTAPLTPRHWYRTGDRVRHEPYGFAFLGRLDNQVKVYGYRVEPGDVEAAIRRYPGVDEAAVVPCVAADSTVELAGFHTGAPADGLREFLERELPSYMVPRYLTRVPAFPLTLNGKVDRTLLAARAGQPAGPDRDRHTAT